MVIIQCSRSCNASKDSKWTVRSFLLQGGLQGILASCRLCRWSFLLFFLFLKHRLCRLAALGKSSGLHPRWRALGAFANTTWSHCQHDGDSRWPLLPLSKIVSCTPTDSAICQVTRLIGSRKYQPPAADATALLQPLHASTDSHSFVLALALA
jgi:hypothetical protein